MKRRYFEIRVETPELPSRKRVFHVITFQEESPINRAVAEGLLKTEHVESARVRELSLDECINSWRRSQWQ